MAMETAMNAFVERWRDELILLGRVLMMLLFLISGWGKLTGFQGTVGYMGTSALDVFIHSNGNCEASAI